MNSPCKPRPKLGLKVSAPATPQDDLGLLGRLFPFCFDKGNIRPLKVNIHDDIMSVTGWSRTRTRRALMFWTRWHRYLDACCKRGAMRVDLRGQPVEEISEEHLQAARTAWRVQRAKFKARFNSQRREQIE